MRVAHHVDKGCYVSDVGVEFGVTEDRSEVRPEKLSELLRHVSAGAGDKITLGQIAEAMSDRSFGAFLVVFCLPNLIPLPPGATFILGLPLIFVSFQMAFSRLDTIWLPRRLRDYAFDNKAFAAVLDRFIPYMERAERYIRPRFWSGDIRLYERLIGVFALILGIIVFLPIPLGNMGPSLALALIGLGLTERDGIMTLAGVIVGLVFTVVVSYVGYELLRLIPYFIDQLPHYWHAFLDFFSR
jgi:hypothetical protein